jgi:predicted ATPase
MKQFESFRLDTANQCLWRDAAQIALPPKPFAVLRYLVENPGRLITHDELLDALWPETYVQPQVLRTYVLDLRKVLQDDAGQPRFIQTLPKRGYCFVASVRDWTADDSNAAALRVQPEGPKAAGIVNRLDEIACLKSLTQLAHSGQRQIVFVTGGAGIGKTALVDAFCRQVESSLVVRMARGQCVEGLGKKEENYPVMEALAQLCASPHAEAAERILATMAPAWLPLQKRERDATTDGPERLALQRAQGDLCGALEEMAQETPLVLVFEDLHWADDSTLSLISALARRRAQTKLMVLATYRPRNGSSANLMESLMQDLLMRRLCTEIVLAPLAKKAVKDLLIRELHQEELPPGLDSFVYEHSEGNPLFVIAILEHLIAQRFLIRTEMDQDSRWEQHAPFPELESGVPRQLAQMIELEIERLDPKQQRILEAASLMNVAFPSWAVAAVLAQDAIETEEACDELARTLYFVHRAGEDELPDGSRSAFYLFAHGLYREVLYQRQAMSRRAKGHTRIAERLGAMFEGREASVARERAMHYEAAGNWHRAVNSLRDAAQHAGQRRAFSEASNLLEHAIRVAEHLSEVEQTATAHVLRGDLSSIRAAIANTSAQQIAFQKV